MRSEEVLIALLVLSIPALIIGSVVMALVALVRTSRLKKAIGDDGAPSADVTALAAQVRRLEHRLRSLESRLAAAPPPAPQPEEIPAAPVPAAASEAPPSPATLQPDHPGEPQIEPVPETAPPHPAPAAALRADEVAQAIASARPDAPEPERLSPEDTAPEDTAPEETTPEDQAQELAPIVRPAAPLPAPPIRTSSAATAPTRTAPQRQGIDWERWIGVRGAAALGGVALAMAGLLFFKYSIEHGLIPPAVRVALGMAVGVACLVASEWLRPRRQASAANALAGGGFVILYASIWAAQALYHLIGETVAFGMMALVTAACGVVAYRRSSLLVAMLGLLGGFATPLLLSSGSDRPVALFTYVLLLDIGLLWLARRRSWPVLAVLGLICTGLYQALWILDRMDAPRVLLGLGILAAFTVAFLLLGRREADEPADNEHLWRLTRAAAVLLPFGLSLYFAGNQALGDHLAPVAGLLVLLSLCACWLAARGLEPLLAPAAAAGASGVVVVWFLSHRLDAALVWEAVACCSALGLVFAIASERTHERQARAAITAAAQLLACILGVTLVLASAAPGTMLVWPWLIGWTVIAAILLRQARLTDRGAVQLVAALGIAAGLVVFGAAHVASISADPSLSHSAIMYLGLLVFSAAVFQVLAMIWSSAAMRRWGEHSAGLIAAILIPGSLILGDRLDHEPLVFLGGITILALLISLVATRTGLGAWHLAAVLLAAFAQTAWTFGELRPWSDGAPTGATLAAQLATVVLLTFWPCLARAAFSSSRAAWAAAALAGPLWFPSLHMLYGHTFSDATIAILPLGLGALTLTAALLARRTWADADPVRTSAMVWLMAVTLCCITVAIPLQLDREWITIGWALNGLALLALWQRLDHPGLKYLALTVLAAATIRLVANPAVLGYHLRAGMPVLNWLLYTYLVPAAALLGSATLLRRLELERLRSWERNLYPTQTTFAAATCGLAAIVVVFVWINLAVADMFGTSSHVVLSFDRMPARDVTTSIAWAIYALVLLAIGVRRTSTSLRWISLGLMVATLAKVFLHDLGQLEDLYRVGSLLGLALSLITVSLIYQRFVFTAGTEESKP